MQIGCQVPEPCHSHSNLALGEFVQHNSLMSARTGTPAFSSHSSDKTALIHHTIPGSPVSRFSAAHESGFKLRTTNLYFTPLTMSAAGS